MGEVEGRSISADQTNCCGVSLRALWRGATVAVTFTPRPVTWDDSHGG